MAAALRAKYRLPLPDMLQVSAAMAEEAGVLVTNDASLRRVEEVEIILLDELLEEPV